MQKWKLKTFLICMTDYERYMYKLVYSSPQLSPTFSVPMSQDAAVPLSTHTHIYIYRSSGAFSAPICTSPSEWQNSHTVDPDLPLRSIIFSNWVISPALNSLEVSAHYQVCHLSVLLHIGVYVRRNVCVCVSVRGIAAQAEGTMRGVGAWRVKVHLTGHLGGLGHSLVHVVVHGAARVWTVLGRLAAAPVALVGVRARAVSLTGVGAGAIALEGGDAGAGGGAGAGQAGHAGRGHWGERRRMRMGTH